MNMTKESFVTNTSRLSWSSDPDVDEDTEGVLRNMVGPDRVSHSEPLFNSPFGWGL